VFLVDFITMSGSLDPSKLGDRQTNQGSGRKEPNMVIIGLDYHPSFQQIAFVDQETGDFGEKRLVHGNLEAESFYRELKKRGVSAGVLIATHLGCCPSTSPDCTLV
jgi:hypothetical protein